MTARRTLALAAGLVAASFTVLHLAGGRACVEVLSGTPSGSDAAPVLGLLYVAAWFGFVVLVPITALALGIDAAWDKLLSARRTVRAQRRAHR